MEVVLVAMSPHHHPQQSLFTKEGYWHKKFVQIWQSSTKHSLDLEARVLDFKRSYLSHLLVFLSDSKDVLLLKQLSTNQFKIFKTILCVRCLMMKKYYKSSRQAIKFPYMTSKDHNLVNFHLFKLILFSQQSLGCLLQF